MPAAEAAAIAQLAQAAADEWWASVCTDDSQALRPELARDYFVNTADPAADEALEGEAQRSVANPEASVFPAYRRAAGGGRTLLGPS
eukprot:6464332-Prymnesium_polylepis.1